MKVLRLRAYHDPEQTAGSHLDHDLCDAFERNNIIYESFTPVPTRGVTEEVRREYKKRAIEVTHNGCVIVHRFSMFKEGKNPIQRAFRYLCCSFKEYILGSKVTDVDVVYSSSTPPTQGLLSAIVASKLSHKYKKKVPFVYNVQDIFPDSLLNAKMTSKGSVVWKIGRKIEDYTYNNADKIIVISQSFKTNLMAKNVPEEKIVVIPNWINTNDVFAVERETNLLFDKYKLNRNKFYISYNGNIGHSQNLDMLIEVAKKCKQLFKELIFVLIGEGAAKDTLIKRVDEEQIDNVVILPFQEYSLISSVFSLGDVGLIISKPGIGGSSVPSKTWSIMAAERPILASFDTDSELAALIKEIDCGVVCKPGDINEMIESINQMMSNPDERRRMAVNGKHYVTNVVTAQNSTKEYISVLKSVLQ